MTVPKTPAERESARIANIELFAATVTLKAWGWKNIDPWQRRVLRCEDRFMYLNCSRQTGKSSILTVKAFHKLLTVRDALILIVAEQRQSNEDMRKLKQLIRTYDDILREKWEGKLRLQPVADNVTSVELANGSRAIALPANEKIRGYSAPTMIIMDEAGYVSDEVFVGADPMLEVSQGQFILASTPNGTTGFFYTEAKNPRYTQFRVPWKDCPRISPESIEGKRLLYGEAYVKQEYECQFLDDIAALFTDRSLRESMDEGEEVFAEEMANINKQLEFGAELI